MPDSPMASEIISLVAETHVHPGVGQSTGALDLPVSRERTTHFPFVPGSGVKGAFRVWATERTKLDKADVDGLFGKAASADADNGSIEGAGSLLCSDARLLLLPVRCLSDAFKWVTCPAILRRFQRDCARAVNPQNLAEVNVPGGHYLGIETDEKSLGLEEREFCRVDGAVDETVVKALTGIVGDAELRQRLVILSDKDFVWFARYALPVMARNVLNKDKISENLWYEETLAPDTVMYALFGERNAGAVKKLTGAVNGGACYIQIGGNETIGQGWFKMDVYPGASNGGGANE